MIEKCYVTFQQIANIAREKEKLELLEQQHVTTVEELEVCADQDEAELLRQRNMDEQDAVDNQKFLVDNLEFQQLEVCETIVNIRVGQTLICCWKGKEEYLYSAFIQRLVSMRSDMVCEKKGKERKGRVFI